MPDLRDQPPIPEADRPEKPDRYSQTFLRHFDRCRRAAYLYLKHKGGVPSHHLDRGTVIHAVAQRQAELALENNEPMVPHDVMRELLLEELEKPGVTVPAEEIDGLREMTYHLAAGRVFDPATIVAIERLVILEIGGCKISCKLDFAWVSEDGKRAGVEDYKSTQNLPDNSSWGPAETEDGKRRTRRFMFQPLLYGLALVFGHPASRCGACGGSGTTEPFIRIKTLNADVVAPCPACENGWVLEDTPLAPRAEEVELAYAYPRYLNVDDDGDASLVSRGTTVTRIELEDHRRWLETVIAHVEHAFETGEWPATPGSHCNECPASGECPIPDHLRNMQGAIRTPEDGAAVAAQWLLLTKQAGELWTAMKEVADQGMPIVVGDFVFEFRSSEVHELKKSRGKNDWAGLQAAIEHSAETGEPFQLERWVKKRTQTRFGKHKLEDVNLEEAPAPTKSPKEEPSAEERRNAKFGEDPPF
jgi:hypothetical protein